MWELKKKGHDYKFRGNYKNKGSFKNPHSINIFDIFIKRTILWPRMYDKTLLKKEPEKNPNRPATVTEKIVQRFENLLPICSSSSGFT